MPDQALTLPEAADKLGVHYMTVYRYVRTGLLPAAKVDGSWLISSTDLELMRPNGTRSAQSRSRGPKPTQSRLLDRLVAGDEAGAWSLLEGALASDMKPEAVMLELIGPTLRTVGSRWQNGELSIADEHSASNVAARLISRLGARFLRRGVKLGTVILAAPAGEMHAAPVAMTANLLRWRGFDVVELGADTPPDALSEAVDRSPDLLALGVVCTTDGTDHAARHAIARVRRTSPDTKVLLGGGAISGAAQAFELGADLYTKKSADEVVSAVEGLLV